MAKAFGDEQGLIWQKEVYIGRSASKGTLKGAKLPNPVGYKPPEYRSILGRERIALDIETFDPKLEEKGPGVYRKDGHLLGVAIDYGDGDRRYFPLKHATGDNLNEPELLRTLKQEAAQFTGTVVNAQLQYDLDWLSSYGVDFPYAKFFDVQFAEPLLNENKLSYKLELLGQQYLGEGKVTSKLEEHYGSDFIKHLKEIHPQYVGEYACGDVYLPLAIMDKQLPILKQEGLLELCQMEHDLLPLLLQMRRVGVPVDIDATEKAKRALDLSSIETGKHIKELCGTEVEIYSADSIARAFDKLGLEYPRTQRGAPSFRREWLEHHPSQIAKFITQRRNYEKISGTFLRNYILEGHVNNRIHCMFNPLRSDKGGTVSGRFSSSYPNLQNIPIRTEEGRQVREAFVAEYGHDWACIDWSQIEYRFLVHYAVAAGCKGAEVACEMYHKDKETDFHDMASEITKKERKIAKNLNFGVVYGMGKDAMASHLGVTVEEAEPILNEFHSRLPWLKEIYNRASRRASQKGYIKTILNRRRRFEVWEKDGAFVQNADYQKMDKKEQRGFRRAFTHKALNALLQGSAADLMKFAMVKAYKAGVFKTLIPHLTVHDELDVSKPKTKEGEEAFKELGHIMETSLELHVPVLAKASIGKNWAEAK